MGNFGIDTSGGITAPQNFNVTEGSAGSSKGSTMGSIAQGALTAVGAVFAPYTGGTSLMLGSMAGQAAKSGLSTMDEAAKAGSVQKTQSDNVVPVLQNIGNPYGGGDISGPGAISGISPTNRSNSTGWGGAVGNLASQTAQLTSVYDKIKDLIGNNKVAENLGSGIDWTSGLGLGSASDIGQYMSDASTALNYNPYSDVNNIDWSQFADSSNLSNSVDWSSIFGSMSY